MEDNAEEFCHEVQEMKSARMVLCKWTISSPNVMVALEWKKEFASKELVVLHEQSVSVLGIAWNPTKDEFSFSFEKLWIL